MSVETSAFRWTEKYSVNIAALDAQHQGFFAIINELNEALARGAGGRITEPVLRKLVEYAQAHFGAEEALMTEYQFPGLETHRMEHRRFAQTVAKFLEDYRAGKRGVPVSLLLFLQTWLKEHILASDQGYSSFLNAQGVH